jgi:phosphorylase kinase alpha/beta subunit
VDLDWEEGTTRPLSIAEATAWQQEADHPRLLQRLGESRNLYEQIELLGLLWGRVGPDQVTELGGTVRQLTEAVYAQAGEARLWGVVRRAAGLLGKIDETLEDVVAEIVARQHQVSVGRAYSSEAVIAQPLSNAEIVQRIQAYGSDDPCVGVLIQEIVLYLGMLIKVDPSLFKGTLTLRAWYLLLLITGRIAQESAITQGEAFDRLLVMSPHAILTRLHQVTANYRDMTRYLTRQESLQIEGKSLDLVRIRFPASDDPALVSGEGGWKRWREINGVLTRLPEDFYPRVWEILQHCRDLVIGDQLDTRNRLDSELLRADMTPAEKDFALGVEELLNNINAPEYRQLTIEALLALSDILRANPRLRISNDIVLDVLIGSAVRLAWLEAHPDKAETYNEHLAWAWDAFYISPPHRVANAVMASLLHLLEETRQQTKEVVAA